MKRRLLHFKKRMVPAVSGTLMGVMLIRLGLSEWFVANNVTLMKALFTSIGNLVGLISAGTTT